MTPQSAACCPQAVLLDVAEVPWTARRTKPDAVSDSEDKEFAHDVCLGLGPSGRIDCLGRYRVCAGAGAGAGARPSLLHILFRK